MADMAPPKKLLSNPSNKYKDTFLCTTDFDPHGHYEVTYDRFSAQTIAGIPIGVFPQYMDQQTSRLWRRPLNPIKRLTGPLRDALVAIKQTYEVCSKIDRIPGHLTEKTYLQHTLWYNQLLWIDLHKRLTRYAKNELGPQATARDLIDTWDHPSTAWSAYFDNFFETALGYQKVNGMEVCEFEDNILDLIGTSKMLMADVEKWVNTDELLYADSAKDIDNAAANTGLYDSAREMQLLFAPI